MARPGMAQLPRKGRAVMSLKPLDDRLICKQLDNDKVSPGGIIIPDTVDKPRHAKVIWTGPGWYKQGVHQPIMLKPGDEVLYSPHADLLEIKHEGQDYLVLREGSVMAYMRS
jgi:chaperonin GroES